MYLCARACLCLCLCLRLCLRRELCVAYLPNLDEISSTHLEPKLPLEALTPVMQSCIDGSKEVYQLLQVFLICLLESMHVRLCMSFVSDS